ncbi:ABC transporter permease [Natronobacterium texcoconense]|uniref:ABC-2 type transport system permease protein n=1 Tax=Natronobacterium texcoconense TaxID=1095778 RepID=A0A1H1HSY2_NATTX|nr:ABC transporter permease [Natronobacterium texcoconense]SDR28512.1 ABC-2 type transport system permease protein [Natronobacterium texcoconense]
MTPDVAHSPTPTSARGVTLERWIAQTRAFVARYARELFRDKGVLFWTLGFPVGFYLLTITVFVPEGVPAEIEPYVLGVVAISYGMFGAIIASLNSFSEQLGADIEADRYVQFRALPLSPTADLAGRMIAGTVLSLVALAAVLPVGVATGARFELQTIGSPLVVLVAVAAFAVVWMAVAVLVSVAVRNSRYASIITVSLALVAFMLSGYNGTDPSVFHGPDALLNLLPHTLATRLVADHLVAIGGTDAGIAPPDPPATGLGVALLVAYAVAALAVAVAVTRRSLYKREVMP